MHIIIFVIFLASKICILFQLFPNVLPIQVKNVIRVFVKPPFSMTGGHFEKTVPKSLVPLIRTCLGKLHDIYFPPPTPRL